MNNPIRSIKHRARHIIEPMHDELGRLRLKVERLEDQIRQERQRATLLEEELAFVRGREAEMARRRMNGVMS